MHLLPFSLSTPPSPPPLSFVSNFTHLYQQAFFIDHVLRTTTFMDPRLPTDVPLINPDFLQNPPPRTRTVRTEVDAVRSLGFDKVNILLKIVTISGT